MSVEQPSSDSPTGPPSGPLSGPSQPPTGPPSEPPSGGGGGGDGGGPGTGPGPERGRPWWGSAPRLAVLAAAVVAAVALVVVLTRSDGTSDQAGGEVFLQAADAAGPDPFTESTAKDSSVLPTTLPTPTVPATATANVVRRVDGGAAGLYGGTRKVASCDVEKQKRALQEDPEKMKAFASALGLRAAGVPGYLGSLTPVQLRMDTRVTNHGYRDGTAHAYQAVLQAGTAVLVDDRGQPRVRCACGNPLTEPVRQQSTPRPKGDAWPSYRTSNVVFVAPATTVVNVFVVYDPDHRDWFHRRPGDTGGKDQKTDPPVNEPTPSVSSPATSTAPSAESSEPTSEAPGLLPPSQTPLPCVSSPAAPDTASPPPCPSVSSAPTSSSPAVEPPSSASESPPDDGRSEPTPEPGSTSPSS